MKTRVSLKYFVNYYSHPSEALKSVMLSSFAKSQAFSLMMCPPIGAFWCVYTPFVDGFINGIILSNT